ncbi:MULTISPECIES: response regulator transcription factor [unclassified Nocardioides]|uniref:response regulator transcription factor n=1 Tax=unclassified Nocardioides TaxID=2615069 RepID=UPI003014295B
MTERLRLAVLDDHQLFAETLTLALGQEGFQTRRFAVPEQPGATEDLLREMNRFRPSIALVDLSLGRFGSGLRLVRPLVTAGTAVLVVTSAPRSQWGECLLHGASRVIAKTAPLQEILACVRDLGQGRTVIDPQEYAELVGEWQDGSREQATLRARLAGLSSREQEVLAQLMEGHTARDIAHEWIVSEATVRTQIRAILTKLEVSSQLAAVVLANQAGWTLDQD